MRDIDPGLEGLRRYDSHGQREGTVIHEGEKWVATTGTEIADITDALHIASGIVMVNAIAASRDHLVRPEYAEEQMAKAKRMLGLLQQLRSADFSQKR